MSTLHRSKSKEVEYRQYLKELARKGVPCVFCDERYYEQIEEFKQFRIINNKFPYTLWDSSVVVAHFMIVPKRHIDSIADFEKKEIVEYHSIASAYERKGYDLYSRGLNSSMKSVLHQHTHLINTDGVKIKGLIYNESPLVHIPY